MAAVHVSELMKAAFETALVLDMMTKGREIGPNLQVEASRAVVVRLEGSGLDLARLKVGQNGAAGMEREIGSLVLKEAVVEGKTFGKGL